MYGVIQRGLSFDPLRPVMPDGSGGDIVCSYSLRSSLNQFFTLIVSRGLRTTGVEETRNIFVALFPFTGGFSPTDSRIFCNMLSVMLWYP